MRLKLPFVRAQEGQSEDAIVEWLEELYKAADATRRRYESDWYTNILFLAGEQWSKAAEDVRRYGRIVVRPVQSKVKIVNNQIYALARQAAAALRDNLARQIAVPASQDEMDVEAAAVGTDFLRARYEADDEAQVRFHETLWCMMTGRTLRETRWDPDAPGRTEAGWVPGLGDISTATLNPFRWHQCPWDDNSKRPSWIIVSDVRSTDEIGDLYGKKVEAEEHAESVRALDKLLAAVGLQDSVAPSAPKRHNAAILKRLYAAPTPSYPRGRMMVWANGVLLQQAELPEGEMPFVVLDWFPIPARAYPLPFITPLRPLQIEINTTTSQLVELKNRQLRGDMATRGSGEITQEVDPETGQKRIRLGTGIEEFQFLRYDLKTSDAEKLQQQLWNSLMHAAGIREPSIGENPPQATTATAVMLLREADVAGLTLFRSGFDQAHCKVARHKMLLARNHYRVPRMVRVVGFNDRVRVRSFFGSELRNTEDVIARSVPMMTEAQRAQLRQDQVERGLFGPYANVEDMYAKLTALLHSGLPDIEEEIDEMLAPLSMNDLRQVVSRLHRYAAVTALVEADARLDQLVLARQVQETQAEALTGTGEQAAAEAPAEEAAP